MVSRLAVGCLLLSTVSAAVPCTLNKCGHYDLCREKIRLDGYSGYFYAGVTAGTPIVTEPEERVSEELLCDEGNSECEYQLELIKTFEIHNGSSSEHSSGTGGTAGVDQIAVALVTSAITHSNSTTHGWASSTSNITAFSCKPMGGYTVWMTVTPQYLEKEVHYFPSTPYPDDPCRYDHKVAVRVPMVLPDGSIAGRRACRTRKNTPEEEKGQPYSGLITSFVAHNTVVKPVPTSDKEHRDLILKITANPEAYINGTIH